MSLLLFFSAGTDTENIPPELRDQFVRLAEEWELSYALGSTTLFRCQVVDRRPDSENAYRPKNDWRVEVRKDADTIIFRGRVVSVQERPIAESAGVKLSLHCISEAEVFESRHVTQTFGAGPFPIAWAAEAIGGVSIVETTEPHSFQQGQTVTLEGLSGDGGVTFSPLNGTHTILSVTSPTNFHVASTQVGYYSYGGTARTQMHLRTILEALETPYLTDYFFSLAPDIALGPLLEKQEFKNATINDIFRHLSKLTGWIHRYLPDRVVEWFAPGEKLATLEFTRATAQGGSGWSQSRIKRASKIILKYGGNQTIATAESIVGDGVRKVFPLLHRPIVTRPISSTAAQVNMRSSPEYAGDPGWRHIGVFGYDTLFEWMYRESDNSLVQRDSDIVKPVGWSAAVYATEQLPATVEVSDPVLVAAMGIREKLVEVSGVVDRNAALQLAQVELAGLSVTPKEGKIVTLAGLTWPGNSANVDMPHQEMVGQFLLVAVQATQTEADLRYAYTALEGNEFTSTWQERVRVLFGGGKGSSGSSTVVSGTITTIPGTPPSGAGTVLGTANRIPLFTSASTVGDSALEQSTDGNLISTPAAISSGLGFRSTIFQGVTDGALDMSIRNASGLAIFEVPTGTRDAKFLGNIFTQQVTSDTDLTLGSTANIVYPTGNYQTHLGGVTRRWSTFHVSEFYAETIVAQETISTIGGSLLIAPTTVLEADVALSATSIVVRHNRMSVGDRILLKKFAQVEGMVVTGGPSGTGPYTYTVTRDHDGSGANAWIAGDAVVTTSAFIDMYSQRGTKSALEVGPTLVGNVRTGVGAFDWSTRWALGNLRGLFGYGASDVFGLAAGIRTGPWFAVDDVNGLRMMFNNTLISSITMAGGATFTGIVNVTGGNAALVDMSNVTTIDGGKITTNTLHGNRITAGTITGDRIVANTINGDRITAGTITGDRIVANTITADKLDVTDLSAINADLGTINAGAEINWDNGSVILGRNDVTSLHLRGPGSGGWSQINLYPTHAQFWGGTGSGGNSIYLDQSGIAPDSASMSLGFSSDPWTHLHLAGDLKWYSPPTTTSDDSPVVYSNANEQFYVKTNGFTGTVNNPTQIVVQNGIVTDVVS